MEANETSVPMKIVVAVLFLFLLAPVILVVPISFSGEQILSFPPESWSLRWYAALADNPKMISAFWTSLMLGAIVTLISLAVAIPAAYVIVRMRTMGSTFLYNLFTAPLLLPTIVLGLAILIVFASIGFLGTFTGLVIGHLVITLPYALRVLATTLGNLNLSCEEAASTLGGRPLTVFRRVTLPMMAPGIVAATALCFLVSFDEVVITLFLTGPRLTTLPVELFHHVESRADPLVASVSVLLILLTLAVVMIVDRTVGLSKTFVK
ncbi:ABC transporter permease [Microvirga subterranea]|uniref:Putative spermidine/putrescine transport system permease protein n=1 Tax=Microvirga subterranea TaxID=186651 RepID=A0A370HPD3_9HYPH|nr:ABC transporter permease [Microvirga subterranea]RDI60210.1 putative spermidine/putrescine transport system permease protein [Microvirga subterranea]